MPGGLISRHFVPVNTQVLHLVLFLLSPFKGLSILVYDLTKWQGQQYLAGEF